MQKSQRFPRAFCGIPQAVFQVYPAIWQERDPFRFQKLALDFLAAKGLVAAQGAVPVKYPVAGQACWGMG